MKTKEEIFELISTIPDPEIPVINIQELGVLRNVEINNNHCKIFITPTYSGCPAMKTIEEEIISRLNKNGILNVEVKIVYSPAWTTDSITEAAKDKLRKYGISPPEKLNFSKKFISAKPHVVFCPRCNSIETELVSQFGSTACKALYRCKNCLEPFDYFKCH